MQGAWFSKALKYVDDFNTKGKIGVDPFSKVFEERRKSYTLTAHLLSDAEIESLRKYIFNYDKLPSKPGDKPVQAPNLIAGEWAMGTSGNVTMTSLADRRISMCEVPDSGETEAERALSFAFDYWKSFAWADDTLAYRKHVVKNFSRMLQYFYEDVTREIRTVIPKTRLESDKDFWEAKRCADHLEGSAELAMRGDLIPTMLEGQTYWKNVNIPAGVACIFTPMNFIYGIPVIQFIGAYLAGAPFIFKGHPFGGICSTTMMRMLIASGADPRAVQKVEGFGAKIGKLVSDERVSVVSLTGSEETAAFMQQSRGLRPTKFEGGGVNWAFVDDGFSDEELNRIAIRLTYSKLGFSSHKCTSLHGIMASKETLAKVTTYLNKEMDLWKIANAGVVEDAETKIVGPCMVHKAQTAHDIMLAAEKAGVKIARKGGKISGDDYSSNAEVIAPIVIGPVKPGTMITVNWDGKGNKTFDLTTTEYFMPILITSEVESFDEFMRFCLFHNHHDLAVSVWTKNERSRARGRKVLAGMLKENDGTDSALDWEEFGASGLTGSGNMGVGDPEATFAIYSRRQKGRHVQF